MRTSGPVLLAILCWVSATEAQTAATRAGARTALPVAEEIALARSAAPAAVSDSARVLAWNGSTYEVAAQGSNGVTCYVARSWPRAIEPHCFDEEGSRTILPIHILETTMRHEGRSEDEIETEVAKRLRSGALRLPVRPAMSYMMSAGQQLISDSGRPVGAWKPHIMIYYPYLTQDALGLGATFSTEAAVVDNPGTALSNIVVVVEKFVPVRGEQRSSQ